MRIACRISPGRKRLSKMAVTSDIVTEVRLRVQRARSVAVLTGAGVSAESGVPTFRGANGLWRSYRAEQLATPQAFARDPVLVWRWYDWRRQRIAACCPNPAHAALAALERTVPDFLLITQNVDGLHRQAGSTALVELHGNLWRVRCTAEETVQDLPAVLIDTIPPCCACGALQRPDVVWFGEPLSEAAVTRASQAAERCEVMLVVGTSLLVHPAAALPALAKRRGAYLVEVNVEPTPVTAYADAAFQQPAGIVLPRLMHSC